jgi:two-component system sensor histidine kinase KdpD
MKDADARPSADELLAKVTAEEKKSRRGKLKIFFGSSAGVGKTYAMLEEARKRAAEGADVLIGYAEQHIRPETESLLLGMEILPYKMVEYKGTQIKEFDLDQALTRKPTLVCVDELAHSNAPGQRHAKRYQDVLELIDAGIDVYTSLNVQHLESVNDIVERTSGIKVRETLPDWVFEQADDVQLIDITPDKLIERVAEGKIYKQHNVEHLTKQFFNRGNLSALRELALRRTADRVDAQMEDFRRENSVQTSWPTADRLLVCVGPSPFSEQLVRAARRMSAALRAQWIAAYVETPAAATLPAEARERLTQTLRLAERLGAQTVTLTGSNPSDEIVSYARTKNVARIVLGKPEGRRWKERLTGSFVDEVIRKSGAIDVYVIRDETAVTPRKRQPQQHRPTAWKGYLWSVLITAATAALGIVLCHRFSIANSNVLMIDLLGVVVVALRFGRGPAACAAALSVAAFDFTVVPPYYSFTVTDQQYLITFAVMLLTALIIGALTDRLQSQSEASRRRERRTAALLDLAKELAATPETAKIVQAAVTHVSQVFSCRAVILLANRKQPLSAVPVTPGVGEGKGEGKGEGGGERRETEPNPLDDEKEQSVAQWVFDHGELAGATTDTLPFAKGLYLPLKSSRGIVGVLGVFSEATSRLSDPDRLHLLEAFANQTALAVERTKLADESREAWERVEAEFLRNTLLSGVSHDLRTPLAAITGSASSLAETNALSDDTRRELARDIVTESERMERLITNLLDMTRLESSGFSLRKEWHALDEIIGAAIRAASKRLHTRTVTTHLPPQLPLVFVDAVAMEQVLTNLLDNAATYTPTATAIDIRVENRGSQLTLEVADHGPGLPPGDPQRVFQKFFRGGTTPTTSHSDDGSRRGVGLGLAICKGIVELHEGTISAQNWIDGDRIGGALFRIQLPTGGTPPTVPGEGPRENTE